MLICAICAVVKSRKFQQAAKALYPSGLTTGYVNSKSHFSRFTILVRKIKMRLQLKQLEVEIKNTIAFQLSFATRHNQILTSLNAFLFALGTIRLTFVK